MATHTTASSSGAGRCLRLLAVTMTACLVGCSGPVTPSGDDVSITGTPAAPTVAPTSSVAPEQLAGLLLVPPTVATGTVTEGTLVARADLQVEVSTVTLDGGDVHLVSAPDGGTAYTFPGFSTSLTPPRAALRVTSLAADDPLMPRHADFVFGADFRKDEPSVGTEVDNGDNLIQRGLSSQPSQYKIDVDDGRPHCRIEGSAGAVEVLAELRTDPDRWYRISCARSGDLVTLTIGELLPDGTSQEAHATATGPIGDVVWHDNVPPLSIGAKLAPNGALIRSATDQFNGIVANPIFLLSD